MMEFYIIGQSLRCSTPAIAAQSLKFLTARFNFSGTEWEGFSKWAHFRQGEAVFDFALDEENEIKAEQELNLTEGEWEVYLTGFDENDSRATTQVFILSVYPSGLKDEPLHPIPPSVAEQIDAKARAALLMAQSVRDQADAGEFNGSSFKVLGFFDTLAELQAAITNPAAGDAYGVATAGGYDNYIYDVRTDTWINNGPLAGTPGEPGKNGTTFYPNVDANGNLNWSNDGGLANPAGVNIRGPQGETGEPGANGMNPYEYAKSMGYTGTEATFYAALVALPYHNARHLPTGSDPILMETGNIKDGAVTPATLDRPYLSLGVRQYIAANTDLNDITTLGCYSCNSSSNTATMLNCPVTTGVFTLDVRHSYGGTRTERPSSGSYYIHQILTDVSGVEWVRRGYQDSSTLTWQAWAKRLDGRSIFEWTFTVNAADWTQNSGYAQRVVSLTDILTTDILFADVNMPQSANVATQEAYLDAWASVGKVQCITNGQIRLTVFGTAPTSDLPVKVIGLRKN